MLSLGSHRCDHALYAWIPEPLAPIASKIAVSSASVEASELGLDRLVACTRWGLPYEPDASLWHVRAIGACSLERFDDQVRRCSDVVVPSREQRHVLQRFTIDSPIGRWRPDVAQRFVSETASRLRDMLQRSMSSVAGVLEAPQDMGWTPPDASEERVFALVSQLVSLWRSTWFSTDTLELPAVVRAVGSAHALARELSARSLSEALSSRPLDIGAAYVEARHWQAGLLADLLFDAGRIDGVARSSGDVGRAASRTTTAFGPDPIWNDERRAVGDRSSAPTSRGEAESA